MRRTDVVVDCRKHSPHKQPVVMTFLLDDQAVGIRREYCNSPNIMNTSDWEIVYTTLLAYKCCVVSPILDVVCVTMDDYYYVACVMRGCIVRRFYTVNVVRRLFFECGEKCECCEGDLCCQCNRGNLRCEREKERLYCHCHEGRVSIVGVY